MKQKQILKKLFQKKSTNFREFILNKLELKLETNLNNNENILFKKYSCYMILMIYFN